MFSGLHSEAHNLERRRLAEPRRINALDTIDSTSGSDSDVTIYVATELPNDSLIRPEAQEGNDVTTKSTPISRASTEVCEEEPAFKPIAEAVKMPDFETNPVPGVIARDYAYHPSNIHLPRTFSPLPIYIWFLYLRNNVRALKLNFDFGKEYLELLGRDLIMLVHLNWITVEDCSWMEARNALGIGLLSIKGKHFLNYDIPLGATRPADDAPIVKHYHERFANCKNIERFRSKNTVKTYDQGYDNADRLVYGPFGQAARDHFEPQDISKLEQMYEYLCGRGSIPECGIDMLTLFEPILHCCNGFVGGRGTPYEKPYEGNTLSAEGTEEHELDIDAQLIVLENTLVYAYVLLRDQVEIDLKHKVLQAANAKKEQKQEPDVRGPDKVPEQNVKEPTDKEQGFQPREVKNSKKRTVKPNTCDDAASTAEKSTSISSSGEPSRPRTRSVVKRELLAQGQATSSTPYFSRKEKADVSSRKEKGRSTASSTHLGSKRARDEGEDDIEVSQNPVRRSTRRTRQKLDTPIAPPVPVRRAAVRKPRNNKVTPTETSMPHMSRRKQDSVLEKKPTEPTQTTPPKRVQKRMREEAGKEHASEVPKKKGKPIPVPAQSLRRSKRCAVLAQGASNSAVS
ncbi:hypothetical protein EW145_g3994 [Phellinidium pouzarii]|uniref:Uncharacterized protein n=1 Tax=Phellinidium pouzarii TaxID=167371 RepID=A0A4S4L530_9AGAM|nr:hypothetical protein EW145_g3994 [Phellinidium pouzarii]